MPTSSELLDGLAETATRWQPFAIAWHLAIGALLLALVRGWLSRRVLGFAVTLSFISVAIFALVQGNAFNTAMFAVIAVASANAARRLGKDAAVRALNLYAWIGVGLVAFGWCYPHFLEGWGWHRYLYAAPLGLLPCPTLSMAIGLTLIAGLSECRSWAGALAATGSFYGFFGVAVLGVPIDLALLAGSVVLGFATFTR
ncbi:MAG: hypothetical protein ND807_17875 [Vicinamibacterales bacterium]|nr:hypothetical protein [Vicinamibacterales bacterium]